MELVIELAPRVEANFTVSHQMTLPKTKELKA